MFTGIIRNASQTGLLRHQSLRTQYYCCRDDVCGILDADPGVACEGTYKYFFTVIFPGFYNLLVSCLSHVPGTFYVN